VTLTGRLLAGALVVIGVLVAAVVIIAGRRLETRLSAETSAQLEREAQLIAYRWDGRPEGADAVADSMAARLRGLRRVTIIGADGTVLGDSEFDGAALGRLENHGDREEIVVAGRDGVGRSVRVSASAGDPTLYVAVREPGGYVRVALVTSRFQEIVSSARSDVLLAGLIAMAGALALAWIFSASVTRPIVELRDVAQAIASGDLGRRPSLSAPGEVGDLSSAVHRMAEQLATRLASLEHEEALLLAVIESLNEGLLVVDARGVAVRLNDAGRALLGVSDEPPFPADRLPPDGGLREALRAAIGGQPAELEAVIGGRTLAVTARPLAGGGAVVALMDLTARRHLETVRRDFVANVSHELKTPLTVISGFAETLQDPSLAPEDRARFTQTILSNAGRMQRLVDDLLDLSRYEAGGWRPARSSVALGPLLEDVVTGVRPEALSPEVAVRWDVDPPHAAIVADPLALRQVLANLLENSLRHTQQGHVLLRAVMAADGGAVITVTDTGTGISGEHLPRIFERFYRVDPARSRDSGGTGLGLAIVRHLVEAHGGTVAAESRVGSGTTVQVMIPG
jgi:two-component system, OmpR family, phosphate regulon sensor histidine kinase PhoR